MSVRVYIGYDPVTEPFFLPADITNSHTGARAQRTPACTRVCRRRQPVERVTTVGRASCGHVQWRPRCRHHRCRAKPRCSLSQEHCQSCCRRWPLYAVHCNPIQNGTHLLRPSGPDFCAANPMLTSRPPTRQWPPPLLSLEAALWLSTRISSAI